ncbi:hypothetical protein [Legionella micdadei]|uniref:Uncharacterized protein n=1 Tax=Legionella micdadei TaxID=451 RepID=A0A098GEP7_LEGMI|nr:hypothetical protein [Legionella micdadei]KTD28662.1 hypothetical protein Lmic_1773 [Legionella micdadei]CEG60445.1 conserved exported protein of unknown function [Legionella micdadei]SCX79000.1 hypothetical protein SAMN02982997_00023 [Legionella micdadei]
MPNAIRVKKAIHFFIAITMLGTAVAETNFSSRTENKLYQLEQMNRFLGEVIVFTEVDQNKLPPPYDFLLTQHLMTMGVEQYYHRTPQIRAIHVLKNAKANTYSRVITMLVDRDHARNNVKMAQVKKDALVVELAFITINFNALPEKIVSAVLNTQIPFGKLLATHKIETLNDDRHYFAVQCNEVITKYIPCGKNAIIYGRTNTIIRKKDKQWLAKVVEILSGAKCKDENCQQI